MSLHTDSLCINTTAGVVTHVTSILTLQGFDTVLSDMLHFTSGVNDVELSLELAGTAMNVATGHYYDLYGEAFEQQVRADGWQTGQLQWSLVIVASLVHVLLGTCMGWPLSSR
jgi:hypothetical protein